MNRVVIHYVIVETEVLLGVSSVLKISTMMNKQTWAFNLQYISLCYAI